MEACYPELILGQTGNNLLKCSQARGGNESRLNYTKNLKLLHIQVNSHQMHNVIVNQAKI